MSPAEPVGAGPRLHTRAGSTAVMTCIAVLALIAPAAFVLQNSGRTQVSFLSLHDRHSLTVEWWAAVAVCGTLTLTFGATRALNKCRLLPRRQGDDLVGAKPTAISHAIGLNAALPQSSELDCHAQHATALQSLDTCA